ncbi:MAG: PilZ domain-containing protein [Candidatus Omnitrophica bacterium]|nr:PilZ domain-containing protein [Candidatus Omnitrophota bacterium]
MGDNEYGQDRRKFDRVKANFIVVYKVNRPIEVTIKINQREISALMLDLSEGGMALITKFDIPSFSFLIMNFTLMNTTALKEEDRIRTMDLEGDVRYNLTAPNSEHRLGIRFTKISQQDKEAIYKFVKSARESFKAK